MEKFLTTGKVYWTIMKDQTTEKHILWISFFAGLLCAISEFIFAIYSHSQSALTDGVYDASELIFIALILFLTPLFHKPISEKHPYGYYQVESIFLIIKGFMMLSVTFGVSAEIIESALAGGNPVNSEQISMFQFLLGIASILVYIIMKKLNHSISSPTVDAELLGWKLDIFYSFGMSIAFFASMFLERTPLAFFAPFFDQFIAVAIMIFMLPENIKMLWCSIKDVFLFPPDETTVQKIKTICNDILEKNNFHPVFFDITRTGRHLWVSVYFEVSGDYLYINDLKETTELVNTAVTESFENCTCELILR